MAILFIYFIICGVTGLILWFMMLKILESKGHQVNYFFTNLSYYSKFWNIIRNEPDNNLRRKYRSIFWWQIALIPIYIIGMFILIGLFE